MSPALALRGWARQHQAMAQPPTRSRLTVSRLRAPARRTRPAGPSDDTSTDDEPTEVPAAPPSPAATAEPAATAAAAATATAAAAAPGPTQVAAAAAVAAPIRDATTVDTGPTALPRTGADGDTVDEPASRSRLPTEHEADLSHATRRMPRPVMSASGEVEFPPGLGAPDVPVASAPALPAVVPPLMPGPREIPDGHPDEPWPPPGLVPPGDSRSLRRGGGAGQEFALVYRESAVVITRFGPVGRRGQWRVVEYPSVAAASHAYAKECSRWTAEGFSDYRGP